MILSRKKGFRLHNGLGTLWSVFAEGTIPTSRNEHDKKERNYARRGGKQEEKAVEEVKGEGKRRKVKRGRRRVWNSEYPKGIPYTSLTSCLMQQQHVDNNNSNNNDNNQNKPLTLLYSYACNKGLHS